MEPKDVSNAEVQVQWEMDLESSTTDEQQKPVKRLLTPLLSKKVPPIPKLSERKPLPLLSSGTLSRMFLPWLLPLLHKGYKRTLQQEDLWCLGDDLAIEQNYKRFRTEFEKILEERKIKNLESKKLPKIILPLSLYRSMKWEFVTAMISMAIANCAFSSTSIALKYLIQAIELRKGSGPSFEGIAYAFVIPVLLIIHALLFNYSLLLTKYIGGQSRTILTKALLEKSLIASSETRHRFPNGKIVAMLGADISRVDMASTYCGMAFCMPIPIFIGAVVLIINIGLASLVSFAVLGIILVMTTYPSKLLLYFRNQANKYTDERVSMTREALISMKMIKLYSWEDAYNDILRAVRKKETSFVLKIQTVFATLYALSSSVTGITSMSAFLVLYALDKKHDVASIFSSLGLINMLAGEISQLPFMLSIFVDCKTAFERVTEYLESPSKNEEQFYDNDLAKGDDVAVKIQDATFAWDTYEEVKPEATDEETEKLFGEKDSDSKGSKTKIELKHSTIEIFKNITLEIKKGEFLIITGSVGCGKTSLLSAMFGLMNKLKGSIRVDGTITFCDEPWVQNASVRENITFGSDFDLDLYNQTIDACALKSDLKQFRAGDSTEIGERGVTLSGGQKARMSLARAVYSNRDIYLFDDILSAVDASVGKHIIQNCLLGHLSSKTRILATHQLSLIEKADRFLFLKYSGEIDCGTLDELLARNPDFENLMQHSLVKSKDDDESYEDLKKGKELNPIKQKDEDNGNEDGADLFEVEKRAVNSVPFKTYINYFNAGRGRLGILAFPLLIASLSFTVFSNLFRNVWLSFWTEDRFEQLSSGVYIGLYIIFTFSSVFLTAVLFVIFGYFTTRASETLHLKAIEKILHVPMSYMDTTPFGRIINRFTKDTNSLDNEIGQLINVFILSIGEIIGVLILAVVYIPWFGIAIPFLFALVICIGNYYQASAREVKRLEAINRSFILNNFGEALSGMSTIKAYNMEKMFIEKNSKFSDMMSEVYFVINVQQRWIGIALDSLAAVVVLVISLTIASGSVNLSPSSSGLLISYIITFALSLSSLMRLFTSCENEMNSVERMCDYAYDLKQEAAYKIAKTAPHPSWPQNGAISFKNVSFRYRENLPLTLKNLSFDVASGSKIGICGRTGAGKSSIMVVLYRLVEMCSGSIEIDGIDISTIGLHNLRSGLSIIPQDPVIFKGTLRSNLDPFNEYPDEQLWDALRRSCLVSENRLEKVRYQTNDFDKFHLMGTVEEEGRNFSLGERQLIALARALVRNKKILIMDEATSSVDYETDKLVQRTIENEFKGCTVLCVAHRLKTIVKHDKILVLDKGKLEEYGTPLELFEGNGIFFQMCKASGITESDF